MEFAVVGGDTRIVWLAQLLRRDGHKVRCAGLERGGVECAALDEALKGAGYVILPLPAGGGDTISAPLSEEPIGTEELCSMLTPGQVVLGGRIQGRLAELLGEGKIKYVDYFEREELAVRNAAFTAEGAAEILMRELPATVLGSRVLVIGFGRIGKILALRLHLMGARVTVSARKPEDWAWIECLGLDSADTRHLEGAVSGFDAVVNTVPAMVLDRRILSQLDEGCLCLDLASKPGGVDFEAAKELGVRAIWALSLPGHVAPASSGAAIRDAIYNIISELGSE